MPEPRGRSLDRLAAKLQELRREGNRVAFTYGAFELLHPGHLELLRRARGSGATLVVAVEDDAAVARREGPGRPVVPLEARLELLSGLRWVDFVIPYGGSLEEVLEIGRAHV